MRQKQIRLMRQQRRETAARCAAANSHRAAEVFFFIKQLNRNRRGQLPQSVINQLFGGEL